ncbi:MAG: hypothetical protein HKO66_04810 [Saprospiraceae bacterium]|nr:hypothetical protein [Bacteroidia bacterium]NNE13359.1 hypothetical protein [Saprospiraceae bacterium]NNL91532.1 hypothetical protein [Saprospiraceae bacterium]
MKAITYTLLLFTFSFSCKSDKLPNQEMVFDQEKWMTEVEGKYPFRANMLKDVVYNDTIRSLSRSEILNLLGEPSYYREDKNFLHYRITQNQLGSWTLKTKTMIIKFGAKDSIEWIKIHE